jgi:hypothetical protein
MLLRKNRPYTKTDRLQDVLALIQVLALHPYRHRSSKGVEENLLSYKDELHWQGVALDHPEFFRVDPENRLGLSLIARDVLPKDDQGNRELPSGLVSALIQAAIVIHNQQDVQANRWKILLPALIGAASAVAVLFIGKLL